MKFDKIINEAQEDMSDAFGKMMGATGTLSPTSDLRWPHTQKEQQKQIEDISEKMKVVHTNLQQLVKIFSKDAENIFNWGEKTYVELMNKEDEGTMTPEEEKRFIIAQTLNTFDEALADYTEQIRNIIHSSIKI
jgi:hypothetical protein